MELMTLDIIHSMQFSPLGMECQFFNFVFYSYKHAFLIQKQLL